MALFFSCLMVGLVVIAVWKRNYKKETIDNILSEGNKKEWLRFLFPMGLWIYDLLSKKQPAQNEEEREWAKALYVREDAKKKLRRTLILGGIIIAAIYILYFIGVAGGATVDVLMNDGATTAFTNIFGGVLGNILNLFIAISCIGTMNGLMLGCCRGPYSLAARGEGPHPELFSQVDKVSNLPNNSAILGLFYCAAWGLYFYLSNLAGTWSHAVAFVGTPFESVIFFFDPTELPIITIYALYIPIFINWMKKATDESALRRYVIPTLAICGSIFMVIACLIGHKMGNFWYLLTFAVIMLIGKRFAKNNA